MSDRAPTAPPPNALAGAALAGAARALAAAAAVCGVVCVAVAAAVLPGCAAVPNFSDAFALPDGETFAALNPLHEPDTSEIEEEWDGATKTNIKTDVKYVGSYTSVTGRNAVVVSGVGLVSGLKNTGGNPAPGGFRTRLLDDMQKRGVKNAKELLARKDTALVAVRAFVPALVEKGDPIDIEVRVPPGSKASDLSGGWLLPCDLTEGAMVQGVFRKGKTLVSAVGPVLIRGADGADRTASLMRGRVLGGGVSKVDRKLQMNMNHRFKGGRMVQKVTTAIGRRFSHRGPGGVEESVAKAHTDLKITLDVLPAYKEDYPRFLRVVGNIAVSESPVARRLRIEQLEEDLNDGPTAEDAAVKLEAVGEEAVPMLKAALENDSEEVRFHAAVALAYLGRTDGLEALRESAANVPAFRVYALAALAAAGGPPAATELRTLLADPLPETRYGAFRALWSVDPDDAYLNHVAVREIDPATDLPTGPTLFHLHPVRVDVPADAEPPEPLVHVNHNRRAEVVLFDGSQRFKTPLTLRAGRLLVGCPTRGETVTISKIVPGREDVRECSTKITDVIAACVELGAAYPDIVDLLAQAHAQHNLPGGFAIDALPGGGRIYERKTATGVKKAPVGAAGLTPNLYRRPDGGAAPLDPAGDLIGDDDEGGGDDGEDAETPAAGGVIRASAETPADEPPAAPPAEDGAAAKFKSLFGGVGDAFGGTQDADDWGGDVE